MSGEPADYRAYILGKMDGGWNARMTPLNLTVVFVGWPPKQEVSIVLSEKFRKMLGWPVNGKVVISVDGECGAASAAKVTIERVMG